MTSQSRRSRKREKGEGRGTLRCHWSEDSQRELDYVVCDDESSLLYIANMAAILLHVWSSRVATLEQPDWCILDLDPKEAPFTDVVTVAKAVQALCDDIGLPTGIK